MTNGAAAGAAAAAAAMANAVKAMGTIVWVEPQVFLDILSRIQEPLVVHSPSGFMTKHKYLTTYKGLAFFTRSGEALVVPASVRMIEAKKIWVPQ